MIAPSITTPAVTYFHSATSSFRARATIVALRRVSRLGVYAQTLGIYKIVDY